jgi:hypothetical protein
MRLVKLNQVEETVQEPSVDISGRLDSLKGESRIDVVLYGNSIVNARSQISQRMFLCPIPFFHYRCLNWPIAAVRDAESLSSHQRESSLLPL